MSPSVELYTPPPEEERQVEETHMPIEDGFEVLIRTDSHMEKHWVVVAFALMLFHEAFPGRQIARVDTCHGTVHMHQLSRNDPVDEFGRLTEWDKLISQEQVDEWYSLALERLMSEAQSYKWRWQYDQP